MAQAHFAIREQTGRERHDPASGCKTVIFDDDRAVVEDCFFVEDGDE